MSSTKISNYFTYKESTNSETANKKGIKNTYTPEDEKRMKYAAARLDTVRVFLNEPMMVNSWFRNEEVNKLVGGVPTSYHRLGLAIDFTTKTSIETTFNKIKDSKLSFDQLIYYKTKNFIHIGFCDDISKERRQVLYK